MRGYSRVHAVQIGDWGKTGSRHQQDVADFMGAIGSHLSPDFIISTGDNLYPCMPAVPCCHCRATAQLSSRC